MSGDHPAQLWATGKASVRCSSGIFAGPLAATFQKRGLRFDPSKRSYIQGRFTLLGQNEWRRLRPLLDPFAIDSTDAARWLGAGYALTQFLTAPVIQVMIEREAAFSLGALVNLMVVVCDRLLDSGKSVEEVLPSNELASGGGNSSAVMVMLREYLRRAGEISGLRSLIMRMFEAEIATIQMGEKLSRREWRRKCCLPFVLMGLPAGVHAGWLYRLGRFFGALDDAIDFEEDKTARQANYWTFCQPVTGKGLTDQVAEIVGHWGDQVLSWWDQSVPKTTETLIYRESFLNLVWAWLV